MAFGELLTRDDLIKQFGAPAVQQIAERLVFQRGGKIWPDDVDLLALLIAGMVARARMGHRLQVEPQLGSGGAGDGGRAGIATSGGHLARAAAPPLRLLVLLFDGRQEAIAAGQDVLGFANQNGISGAWNAATGTLTLSGSSSVANYQTALRSVTFASTSDDPTVNATRTSRSVSWAVTDANSDAAGAQTSAGATSTITALSDTGGAGTDISQSGYLNGRTGVAVLVQGTGTVDATPQALRQSFNDCMTAIPSGSSGANQNAGWGTAATPGAVAMEKNLNIM